MYEISNDVMEAIGRVEGKEQLVAENQQLKRLQQVIQ